METNVNDTPATNEMTSNVSVGLGGFGTWRSVPGFPEAHVKVSSLGFVKTRCNGRTIDSAIPHKGCIRKHDKRAVVFVNKKQHFVYRLVALAFHGHPPSSNYTVDHINRDQTDNRECNLRWSRSSEQISNQGDRKRKRTCLPIRMCSINDEERTWKTYNSALEASLETGIHQGSISAACRGKVSTASGYICEYDTDNMESESLDNEIWHPCIYDEQTVMVSNMGRIKRKLRSCWQRPVTPRPLQNQAYATMKIRGKMKYVHVVVFESCSRRRVAPGHVIDHVMGDKSDNRFEMLQEVTPSANILKATRQPIFTRDSTKKKRVVVWKEGEQRELALTFDSMIDACRRIPTFSRSSISNAFIRNKSANIVKLKGYFIQMVTTGPTE
jgi:hypothetical protein